MTACCEDVHVVNRTRGFVLASLRASASWTFVQTERLSAAARHPSLLRLMLLSSSVRNQALPTSLSTPFPAPRRPLAACEARTTAFDGPASGMPISLLHKTHLLCAFFCILGHTLQKPQQVEAQHTRPEPSFPAHQRIVDAAPMHAASWAARDPAHPPAVRPRR